jgi:hypothetical protein
MRFPTRSKQRVQWLLAHAEELRLGRPAVQRLQWFTFALNHEGNTSLTSRHFGIARSTLLRWIDRFDPNDERSLEDTSKRPKQLRQSTVGESVIAEIRKMRTDDPTMSRDAIAAVLRQGGIAISPSSIGRIITKHRLFFGNKSSHRTKRQTRYDILEPTAEPQRKAGNEPYTDMHSLSPSLA